MRHIYEIKNLYTKHFENIPNIWNLVYTVYTVHIYIQVGNTDSLPRRPAIDTCDLVDGGGGFRNFFERFLGLMPERGPSWRAWPSMCDGSYH